jgi:hypothetical protein
VLLAAALTACSISLPDPAASSSGSASESSGPTGEPPVETAPAESSAADPSSSASESQDASLGPVVATRSGSADGKTIELDLYRIVRDGSLAQVTFTVRSADDAVVGDLFSDRESHDYEADGVTLIDPAARKLYLVASHGQGRCLCTSTGALTLSADAPSMISASFAAPPPSVSAMDVQIPHFGVFSRVPVE